MSGVRRPERCLACGISLVSVDVWTEMTPAERVGKARHHAKGLCNADYLRSRNPAQPRPALPDPVPCSNKVCTHLVATRAWINLHGRGSEVKRKQGDGLCESCYSRRRRHEDPTPRGVTRTDEICDEVLDEWEFLRDGGVRREDAAAKLGVAPSTFERILKAAREAGDTRGGILPYGNDVRRRVA